MALVRDLGEIHSIGAETREWLVGRQACPGLADHGITLFGVSEARPGFRFVRQDWNLAQILVTVSGHGRVLVGREWLRLETGQAYLQPAHALHAYQAMEAWTVAWVMFADGGRFDLDAPAIRPCDDGEALRAAILGLHGEVHGAHGAGIVTAYLILIDALLRRGLDPAGRTSLAPLWALISGDPGLGKSFLTVDIAARVSNGYPWPDGAECPCGNVVIIGDPGRAWTLDDLAREAGLHPEALRRRCRAETGTSPMRRVADLRLQHAAALLTSSPLSISAIAERVGYSDAFAFTTAFRRRFGHPPSQHRQ